MFLSQSTIGAQKLSGFSSVFCKSQLIKSQRRQALIVLAKDEGAEAKQADQPEVKKIEPSPQISKAADALVELSNPMLTTLGISGAMGIATAAVFKAISFAVAFFVGVTFLVVQYLAYKGLVQVNWDKISDMAVTTLDLNKDGKLSKDDAKELVAKVLSVGSYGLPSAGGYIAGVYLGLNWF